MKRLLSIFAIISVVFIQDLNSNVNFFQDDMDSMEVQETLEDTAMAVEEVVEEVDEPEQLNFHQEFHLQILQKIN